MHDVIYQKLQERTDDELLMWMREWCIYLFSCELHQPQVVNQGIQILGWIQTERVRRDDDDIPL